MESEARQRVPESLDSGKQTAKETGSPGTPTCTDSCSDLGPAGVREEGVSMRELEALVQEVVKTSSWWERHGLDWFIFALNFLSLPLGFLCLRSQNTLVFALGIIILGMVHYTFTVKGSHLTSHGALTNSKFWNRFWMIFFVEVCASFTAENVYSLHVKMHHGYTNVVGIGDLSMWKEPRLNKYVYIFLVPFMVPIILPIWTLGLLRNVGPRAAVRTLCLISLGIFSQYWLLIKVSGFQSFWSTFLCMFIIRGLLTHAFVYVNIFQHMALPIFSLDTKPGRIHMMSLGVLNLPRNPILDWTFGHSVISCHVEHHLFPRLSDNMCLKVKPVVSQFLQRNHLPYNEDSYLSRFWLFLSRYEEFMVHAPAITDLVGLQ